MKEQERAEMDGIGWADKTGELRKAAQKVAEAIKAKDAEGLAAALGEVKKSALKEERELYFAGWLAAAAQAQWEKGVDLLAPLAGRGMSRAQNGMGQTALGVVAGNGSAEGVRLLLAKGAAAKASGWGKEAPLAQAAENGHAECVRALLPVSDAMALDAHGRTALMMAAWRGHEECVAALLPASDPKAKDSNGCTALMAAAHGNHAGIVKLLAAVGDATATLAWGKTAFSIAVEACARRGDWACVDLLAFSATEEQARAAFDEHGLNGMGRWAACKEAHDLRVLTQELAQAQKARVGDAGAAAEKSCGAPAPRRI